MKRRPRKQKISICIMNPQRSIAWVQWVRFWGCWVYEGIMCMMRMIVFSISSGLRQISTISTPKYDILFVLDLREKRNKNIIIRYLYIMEYFWIDEPFRLLHFGLCISLLSLTLSLNLWVHCLPCRCFFLFFYSSEDPICLSIFSFFCSFI